MQQICILLLIIFIHWSDKKPRPERCEVMRLAGLYVCLPARISQKSHVQTSRNFLHMLHVAVARYVICYVLPVLWMMSYIIGQITSLESAKLHLRGEVCCHRLPSFVLIFLFSGCITIYAHV